ncbi:MAG: TetR/AcrR family transcriptional regulator, partial [Acidithiobacillales bacterium]
MDSVTTASRARSVHHHDPNIRQRLIDVAMDLFTRHGYSATSVREIVEGAGVSKPVLYYHFGCKEGLYLEIMRRLKQTLDETLGGHRQEGRSARERIRSFGLGIFDVFSKNTAAVRFLNSVFWGPPQGAPDFDVDSFLEPLMTSMSALVEDGVSRGEFRKRSGPDLSFGLIGALSFAMDFHLAHPDRSPGREGLARNLGLILAGAAGPGLRG